MSIASSQVCAAPLVQDKSLGHFLYGLMSAFPLFFLPVLCSLWINLIQTNIEPSSLLGRHLRWQRVSVLGLVLMMTLGYLTTNMWMSLPIYILAIAWFCYRIFKGWISLNEGVAV